MPAARLVKEQPDVLVLYEDQTPIGNITLERYRMDVCGATLRWMDELGRAACCALRRSNRGVYRQGRPPALFEQSEERRLTDAA